MFFQEYRHEPTTWLAIARPAHLEPKPPPSFSPVEIEATLEERRRK
jgi:hypothetical protein